MRRHYYGVCAVHNKGDVSNVASRGRHTKNEAMNHSVAAYAPKGKTYCLTPSLTTRVAIAAGVANVGKKVFWERAFKEFNIPFDTNLSDCLKAHDKRATKKRNLQQSKEGKIRRSNLKYKKLKTAKSEYLLQQRTGMEYSTGIALAAARKTVRTEPSSKDRNAGVEREKWRCIYHHPDYCVVFGHKDARSKACYAHALDAKERKLVLDSIFKEAVEKQVKNCSNGE